jgi:hypothetical protein
MSEKKELAVKEETQMQCSPAEIINSAIAKGADLEKIEKLMVLQEKWEANQAKKAYYEAMSNFKASPPEINKDRKVGYESRGSVVGYKHASLYNVTDKINASLSKHGLFASWTHKQNDSLTVLSVTCRIVHVKGYGEETTLSANIDMSGSKNPIQGLGSTNTYLERYTLLSLTGLATYDDDDGAATAPVEIINAEQLNELEDLMIATSTDVTKFLAWLKVESIVSLPKSDFNKARVALEAKLKSVKEAK